MQECGRSEPWRGHEDVVRADFHFRSLFVRSGNLWVMGVPCRDLGAPLLGLVMELGAQCKMKMCNPLFKQYQDFQGGSSTALNQAVGPF